VAFFRLFLSANIMNVAQWTEQVCQALLEAAVHFGHGTDNARDEAAWLVLSAIHEPVDGHFCDWDRELIESEEQQVSSLLQARITQKVPLAYLTGRARFAGLEFESGQGALVPRSPIAELIREQFSPWVQADRVHRVLDMCTGSACIAIAIAHYLPWTQVDAVDISGPALEIAARNVSRHGMQQSVTLIESDLFHSLPACRYDLIVANPPYVPRGSVSDLPGEYRAEPVLGLVSGDDGLDATLSILAQAPDFLAPSGVLLCEVGESEGRLQDILPGLPFVWLEFVHGGSGVFVLGQHELKAAGPDIRALLEERKHVA
jgi:ribosomal protein L3 glutamine methyltransferase